jgi:hypothetical protein
MADEVLFGADALDVLTKVDESTDVGFNKFNVGSSYTVMIPNISRVEGEFKPAMMSFFNYGVYNVVDSFVAETPSKKSDKGYPTDDLTPWDMAWKYHQDLSKKFQDKHSTAAQIYRVKHRYAIEFINLADGERIIIDVSKKQALVLYAAMVEFEEQLESYAFKVSKATGGVVALTPVLGKLTPEQTAFKAEADLKGPITLTPKMLYKRDTDDMTRALVTAGFDISLIGLSPPPPKATDDDDEEAPAKENKSGPIEISSDDLPF